jgi:hypothetical protein
LPGKILPGLSKEVEAAVEPAAEMVLGMAREMLASR